MVATPHRRHMRHSRFSRTRRQDELLAFLTARSTDLDSTGKQVTYTVNLERATATLTLSGNAEANDTVTLDEVVYTFVSTLTAAFQILIGATASDTLDNLVAGVTAGAGAGTTYGTGTTAHTTVTAAAGAGDTVDVTCIAGGTAGNSIAVSVDFATAENANWDGATLSGGGRGSVSHTTHGLVTGEGPFLATNSGGALPAGQPDAPLYIEKIDADSFYLLTNPGGPRIELTGAGTGTHTLTKAEDEEAIFEYIARNNSMVVAGATDVDNL